MPAFSEDQVIALAPDESSARSGRDLANPRKWVSFGAAQNAIWGECQGSGSSPYQTSIDTSIPAFKCSCPSRKFPCKHGLGLLLLFARDAASFAHKEIPDWTQEWIQGRLERQEKKEKKKELGQSDKAADPVARTKRQAERKAKVEAGIFEFRLWLQDRIRQGLSGMESQSYQFWETAAARLTDAQAPGLARMLRQCAGIPNSGPGWQARLLEKLSALHMAAEGYLQINELPEDLQEDLRSVIGFTVSQDDILKEEGLKDRFQIMGQRVDQEDRLKVQRTWLRGEATGKWALVFNFAHGMQPLDISLLPGTFLDGQLAFFPGAFPLRALVKSRLDTVEHLRSFKAYATANDALRGYAEALALNPWLEIFPLALENVFAVIKDNGDFGIVDADNMLLPLSLSAGCQWQILALTGGQAFSIFGEWNGEFLLPLSLICQDKFARLDARLAANVT